MNSYYLFILLCSFRLGALYISQLSSMCYLVSATPHLWQLICWTSISFLVCSVSLDPSHPILILNIYFTSIILCLLVFMYSYALASYLSPPNSQNNNKVGNTFCVYVLSLAFLMISSFIACLTILFHLL